MEPVTLFHKHTNKPGLYAPKKHSTWWSDTDYLLEDETLLDVKDVVLLVREDELPPEEDVDFEQNLGLDI